MKVYLGDTVEGVPAFGFDHRGVFVTNPTVSECTRFAVLPEYYGITPEESEALIIANAALAADYTRPRTTHGARAV